MAKAKVHVRNTPREINLRLTEGEADCLIGLLNMVGGDPANSPRKYVTRIVKALTKATGYSYAETDSFPLAYGHVEFASYGTRVKTVGQHLKGITSILRGLPYRDAENELLLLDILDRMADPSKPINHPSLVKICRDQQRLPVKADV